MISPIEQWWPEDESWQQFCASLESATTLSAIVWIAWQMGFWVARKLVEAQLKVRAEAPTQWSECEHCTRRLRSNGFEPRQMVTLVGRVKWRRRVGVCPNKCLGSRQIPLDYNLGIAPHQQTSEEVQRLGCLLCVFLPFELSSDFLSQLTGLRFDTDTLWSWVHQRGQQAMEQLSEQLGRCADGEEPEAEALSEQLAQMSLAIGADGVKVPFRPTARTPKGKTQWREVKIGVLARLEQTFNSAGKRITRLRLRRLVGVLGDMHELGCRLQWEALRQGVNSAPQVVWLSDGAKGFWRLYERYFADVAVGVLDFYHAAGQLWRAAAAYLDGRTSQSRWWFEWMRHRLRHGRRCSVLKQLIWALHQPQLDSCDPDRRKTVEQVSRYFQDHIEHIDYRKFEQMKLPLGSGMVESACK